MRKMPFLNEVKKTIILLTTGSLISISFAGYIQMKASRTVSSCSYLDPILIDIVAFCAGLFLVIDAAHAIFTHLHARLSLQVSRCIRMWLGLSILTIHLLQFLHK